MRLTTSIKRSVPYLVPLIVLAASNAASAQTATGGLPWDAPLTALTTFLTGGVAKSISIIAIFVAGVALIFGEDLGGFAKRLLMIVIAVALLAFSSGFITSLFTGAPMLSAGT